MTGVCCWAPACATADLPGPGTGALYRVDALGEERGMSSRSDPAAPPADERRSRGVNLASRYAGVLHGRFSKRTPHEGIHKAPPARFAPHRQFQPPHPCWTTRAPSWPRGNALLGRTEGLPLPEGPAIPMRLGGWSRLGWGAAPRKSGRMRGVSLGRPPASGGLLTPADVIGSRSAREWPPRGGPLPETHPRPGPPSWRWRGLSSDAAEPTNPYRTGP